MTQNWRALAILADGETGLIVLGSSPELVRSLYVSAIIANGLNDIESINLEAWDFGDWAYMDSLYVPVGRRAKQGAA